MMDWIMYADIQDLKRKGLKRARVAKILGIHRETVTKYWNMTPDEFEAAKSKHRERKPDINTFSGRNDHLQQNLLYRLT